MLGELKYIQQLIKMLGSSDSKRRGEAVTELAKMGENKWRAIVKGNSYKEDIMNLGICGDPRAVEPLIEALEHGEFSPGFTRKYAAAALGVLGNPKAGDALLGWLNRSWPRSSIDSSISQEVIIALGKIKDARAVDLLIKVLEDVTCDFQKEAVIALGELQDIRSIVPLIKATSYKYYVRWDYVISAACKALETFNSPVAVKQFIIELNIEDAYVRERAAQRLGFLKVESAVEPLIKALTDENIGVRREAIRALMNLNDPRAKEAVIKVRDENILGMRDVAAEFLKRTE